MAVRLKHGSIFGMDCKPVVAMKWWIAGSDESDTERTDREMRHLKKS